MGVDWEQAVELRSEVEGNGWKMRLGRRKANRVGVGSEEVKEERSGGSR